jgi:cell wall assembly regulator SMI1
VERGWPGDGPWIVAATSGDVDWRIAAAALAAAAEVSVGAVVVGAAVAADDPVRPHLAGLLELPSAGDLPLLPLHGLVRAMCRAHGLVLVAAPAGLLMPVGAAGWTLADLAEVTGAGAVVVTGPGPDAVNHTTLALGALSGQGIPARVVTLGDVDEDALPVTVAGRIPAERPADLAGAAGWFEPVLRVAAAHPPAPAPAPATGRRVTGKRLLLALAAVFLAMVAVVCGLAWSNREPEVTQYSITMKRTQGTGLTANAVPVPPPVRPAPSPRRSAANLCPENAGRVTVARPNAATTARVNAAWQRIEKWLAAHTPAAARALRPPARAAKIDEMQRRMSVVFPPDLVASLRRHDGVSGMRGLPLPPYYYLETVDGIFGDWRVNCDVLGDIGLGESWWHPAFVPFAQDGGGGSLLADQRSGGHGRVGEFYPESGTTFERWPASVTELLEKTATALEHNGTDDGRYRLRVDADGYPGWDII